MWRACADDPRRSLSAQLDSRQRILFSPPSHFGESAVQCCSPATRKRPPPPQMRSLGFPVAMSEPGCAVGRACDSSRALSIF